MDLTSQRIQIEMIYLSQENLLKQHKTGYLIYKPWWDYWVAYVGFCCEQSGSRPSIISNECLIQGNEFAPDISSRAVIASEQMWQKSGIMGRQS